MEQEKLYFCILMTGGRSQSDIAVKFQINKKPKCGKIVFKGRSVVSVGLPPSKEVYVEQ